MHKQKPGQCDHRRQTRQYPVACELCGGSCSQPGSHIFQLTLFSGVQHCFSTLQTAQNRSVAMQLKPTTTVRTVQEVSLTTPGCCTCCCHASAAVQATAWRKCVAAQWSSVWRQFLDLLNSACLCLTGKSRCSDLPVNMRFVTFPGRDKHIVGDQLVSTAIPPPSS